MEGKRYRNRTTEICQILAKDECRFAYGVQNLVSLRSEKFEEGYSYHILTDGKVDMLNHLRWLMMLYGRIDEVYLSSWSINATNILMLESWHDSGELGDVNLIVGEIFPAKFKEEWKALVKLRDKGTIARLFTGRIHAKIILARAASGEEIVVETSANANMNPRCEQSSVSVSRELFDFYKSYFDVKFGEYVRKQSAKELTFERLDYEADYSEGTALFGQDD